MKVRQRFIVEVTESMGHEVGEVIDKTLDQMGLNVVAAPARRSQEAESRRLHEVLATIAEHHHEAPTDPGWCNHCGHSFPCWTRVTALLGTATPDQAGPSTPVPTSDRSVALGKSFVDAASESQKVTRQTEAVLKSMPADEDVPVPPWPLRWGEPMNGYTACVAIDCPPDVVLKQVHR